MMVRISDARSRLKSNFQKVGLLQCACVDRWSTGAGSLTLWRRQMVEQSSATDKLANVLVKIKRWESRAKRAANALAKLEKERRKIERVLVAQPKTLLNTNLQTASTGDIVEVVHAMLAGHGETIEPKPVADVTDIPISEFPIADDLDIPGFLRRDAKVAAEIKQEIADQKRTKAQVRIEKLKAKQSGATKRMPLQGKEALAAIRG
jgi:hypothetical protein